ncbi:stage V sporulation protein AD [Lachnospiraceae bacterium MD329]|nr:stage V sporulation protein AD [Lachnospiraceae bacterium MD329]
MIDLNNRIGKQTVILPNKPVIIETASIAGVKEGEGPLKDYFDRVLSDDTLGEKSWEKSESSLQRETAYLAINKSGFMQSDIDYILAGDLLNQCVGAHYSVRDLDIPFFGLYGACSTMSEGLSIGSMLVDGGYANRVMCMTSSHFCSSERQFRNPLEYGGQRTPSAQWTVTGAGCAILAKDGDGPKITHITTGKVIDKGITDVSNMGAAMAPAAIDTLIAHFNDTGRTPDYYDMILTGDLGVIGSDILTELMLKEGFDLRQLHSDCGKMIYDIEKQDVHAGGSGCGCFGSVFCGYIFNELRKNNIKKILVMATGALMNPTVIEQGESIPGVAHAVAIEN